MYFIGHAYLTYRSGAFDEDDAYGSGLPFLMLPDYGSCHHWCYDHVWEAHDHGLALARSHIIADWYVHFGPTRRNGLRKVGWAYNRMRVAAAFYDEFFGLAAAEGVRDPGPPGDSLRGFSHSMLEYAIDTHIARRGLVDDHWPGMQSAIQAIEDVEVGRAALARYGAVTDVSDLPQEIWTYQARVQQASEPQEVAFYCIARKFGLRVDADGAAFVRRYQDRLLREIAADELDDVCTCVSAAITEPLADRWPELQCHLVPAHQNRQQMPSTP